VEIVIIIQGSPITYNSPKGCSGNLGGDRVENFKGGGGGGAGSLGQNHGVESTPNDGYGGDGMSIDITGVNVICAAGGNGSDFQGVQSQTIDPTKSTIQGRGGVGFGSDNNVAQPGKSGNGGGGGGQATDTQTSGAGGSGFVIIRYKYTRTQTQVQTINNDYKYISFASGSNLNSLYFKFP